VFYYVKQKLNVDVKNLTIFSSPEHEVVKVRYSDGAMSGVRRRASFVVNNWVVNSLAVTVLIGSLSNFVRMFVSIKYRSSLKMGYLESKTRSQELKIEKNLLHSSGCSFDPYILENCQEGCFDDFLVKFEDGSSPVKN
jgi:hypothetical protein